MHKMPEQKPQSTRMLQSDSVPQVQRSSSHIALSQINGSCSHSCRLNEHSRSGHARHSWLHKGQGPSILESRHSPRRRPSRAPPSHLLDRRRMPQELHQEVAGPNLEVERMR